MSNDVADSATVEYTFPEVDVGDYVLFASGPEADDWAPMLVTGINTSTIEEPILDSSGRAVLDAKGRPKKTSHQEPRSLRGVVMTHTGGCMQVGMSNIYHLDGPAMQDNKDLWQAVTVSPSQGVFKLTKSGERLVHLNKLVTTLLGDVIGLARRVPHKDRAPATSSKESPVLAQVN